MYSYIDFYVNEWLVLSCVAIVYFLCIADSYTKHVQTQPVMDYSKAITEFSEVVSTIQEILHQKLKSNLVKLKSVCFSLTSKENTVSFTPQEAEKIRQCESVYDLFFELRGHWRYDRHEFLYSLVKRSGSQEALEKLKIFRSKLSITRKLKEVYDLSQTTQAPLPKGYTKMVAIVEKDHDEITLEELDEIDSTILSYLGGPALRPPSYEAKYSIKITWYIPIEAVGSVLKKAFQAKKLDVFKILSISFFEVHDIILLNEKWPSSVQVLN